MNGNISGVGSVERPARRLLLAAALLLIVTGVLLHASGMDVPWMLRVHEQAPQALSVVLWSSITVLGLGSAASILVLASDRGQGRIAALLLPILLLGGLMTHLPKWWFAVPRPAGSQVASQLHVIGHAFSGAVSMPSGHSVTAGAAAVLLCIAFGLRPLASAAAVLGGMLVAWSRVAVGAHWPSDVFVGFGLGFMTAVLILWAGSWPRVRQAYDALVHRIQTKGGQFAVAAVEVAAAVALLTEHTGYPAARPMVLLIATVAAASALLRCHFAVATAGRATVGPT
jgi:membrane-associated phospholipid phosphatase